jgi:3-hydroxyisobutyrate dehydrogenase-like beta-hydroxyacid dehydrogenase
MAKVGFVGLGVMGGPMAGHLLKAGHEVVVWNRTASKAEPLRASGARVAPDLARLAEECPILFLCVSKSEDVRACLAAMVPHSRPGTLFVDHSTIAPGAAEEIAVWLAGLGFRFLDAPVTGGSMGAQSGTLTVFVGGEKADFGEVEPILAAYAKKAEHVGPSGAGQMVKMANQIAVGGALLGLCESLALVARAGLDVQQAWRLISGGAGGSWAFQNYGPKILSRDWSPGFSIENQVKDFAYCREAAEKIGAAVPMTALAENLLRTMLDEGRGGDTTAALYELYERGWPLP